MSDENDEYYGGCEDSSADIEDSYETLDGNGTESDNDELESEIQEETEAYEEEEAQVKSEIQEETEAYEEEEAQDEEERANQDCYGHGGTDMSSYDSYATYPESHFAETDARYLDEESEMTEATNQKALRELEEFQRLEAEQAEAERQAEYEAEQAEADAEISEKQNKYKDLDSQYQQIKNDIEMSKSEEERNYWQKRGDSIWEERDRLGGEIEDLIRKKRC